MILDFNQLAPSQRYFAMVQTIIPRPIAWVLTDNGDAREHQPRTLNLAPFSFFTGICSDPPLLMISAKRPRANRPDKQKIRGETFWSVNILLCTLPPPPSLPR